MLVSNPDGSHILGFEPLPKYYINGEKVETNNETIQKIKKEKVIFFPFLILEFFSNFIFYFTPFYFFLFFVCMFFGVGLVAIFRTHLTYANVYSNYCITNFFMKFLMLVDLSEEIKSQFIRFFFYYSLVFQILVYVMSIKYLVFLKTTTSSVGE